MISRINSERYCCEDIRNIENYERASNDLVETWDLHHRKEDEGYSKEDLIDSGLYYKRPACELIFLTHSEHSSLHKKGEKHPSYGKHHSEEWKMKISEALKGIPKSEEHKRKISIVKKGRKRPEITGEKHYKSKPVLQINKTTGEIIKIWPCTWEVQRQLGIKTPNISKCCSGKRKSAGGFVWRYEQ